MQHCARRSGKPCCFRKLAEHAGHQVEHHQPPGALVAVMQPLGGDGKPQSSHGMSTRTTATMKSGAAMPAAVNRITAAISPATVKRRVERQYLARLMRRLAPNRNSNRSSMIPLHAKCTKCTGGPAQVCVAPKQIEVQDKPGDRITFQCPQRRFFLVGATKSESMLLRNMP